MRYIHFKMKTIKSILALLTSHCYMVNVDIKNAYYSVSILPELHNELKFYFRGNLYQFTCLPNGLCLVPHKFTKLLKLPSFLSKVPASYCSRFIDDLITLSRSFVGCEMDIKLTVTLLENLGFVVY